MLEVRGREGERQRGSGQPPHGDGEGAQQASLATGDRQPPLGRGDPVPGGQEDGGG